jgi:hypothetical protein
MQKTLLRFPLANLKSAPKGIKKKNFAGEILKEFFARGKIKLTYFIESKDLFTF